ncbi:hypothetical protein RYX41_11860 [Lactiplantibacillus plantarum]|nr:hypothetical protein [Lactiplantibacillus plantarum]
MTADMMQNTAIKTGQWTAGIRMAGQYPVFLKNFKFGQLIIIAISEMTSQTVSVGDYKQLLASLDANLTLAHVDETS